MTLLIQQPQVELAPRQNDLTDDDIRTQVWELLATLYPKNGLAEQRCETRYPFPYLVHLTPVAEDGCSPQGDTFVVVGKHLSERGLGFYHPQPLPYRRMIVSLETETGQWLAFLIDLSWCRFTKQGWYESGGRFLQSVLSPIRSCP